MDWPPSRGRHHGAPRRTGHPKTVRSRAATPSNAGRRRASPPPGGRARASPPERSPGCSVAASTTASTSSARRTPAHPGRSPERGAGPRRAVEHAGHAVQAAVGATPVEAVVQVGGGQLQEPVHRAVDRGQQAVDVVERPPPPSGHRPAPMTRPKAWPDSSSAPQAIAGPRARPSRAASTSRSRAPGMAAPPPARTPGRGSVQSSTWSSPGVKLPHSVVQLQHELAGIGGVAEGPGQEHGRHPGSPPRRRRRRRPRRAGPRTGPASQRAARGSMGRPRIPGGLAGPTRRHCGSQRGPSPSRRPGHAKLTDQRPISAPIALRVEATVASCPREINPSGGFPRPFAAGVGLLLVRAFAWSVRRRGRFGAGNDPPLPRTRAAQAPRGPARTAR